MRLIEDWMSMVCKELPHLEEAALRDAAKAAPQDKLAAVSKDAPYHNPT